MGLSLMPCATFYSKPLSKTSAGLQLATSAFVFSSDTDHGGCGLQTNAPCTGPPCADRARAYTALVLWMHVLKLESTDT